MEFPSDQVLGDFMINDDDDTQELGIPQSNFFQERDSDPFLQFIHYARSTLFPYNQSSTEFEFELDSPGWGWMVNRILKTCVSYSSGVTPAILLSELFLAWNEQNRSGAMKKHAECIIKLKKNKRPKLPNTVTIDSIYEKKFLSLSSVIEAVVLDSFVLPGTDIFMVKLGDVWSSNTVDIYLHRRFYDIADPKYGILKKGREVLLTGCCLRVAGGGSRYIRLLPTEYFVVLLDEDEDEDAMLLGAQFCADSFSSISLDAFKEGESYSLYARIAHIGKLEIHGKHGSSRRKQIVLVDNDGMKLKFLLWGEQTLVANLFSVGSMLALDKPYIANPTDTSLGACDEICLEYGSATQLYLVPLIQHKEQVCLALTQNHYQGSRMASALNQTQGPIDSQVSLPCDSQGSIDFRNCPIRSCIVDLRDKMTGISLYGIVTGIQQNSESEFSLKIEDTTGAIWTKLHFVRSWSLKRLGMGHMVYVSGLSSLMAPQKSLELSWYETDGEASLINISSMPAFLNTPCLHKSSCLSDLSIHMCGSQVCRIWLDQIEHCHVDTRCIHYLCGHFVDMVTDGDILCKFCNRMCSNAEVERTFHLKLTIADETTKVFAWCIGKAAAELLQISPDEFSELPEEEQIMYPSSLGLEKFIVAIVNSRRQQDCDGGLELDTDMINWEVTCAIKCE